MTTIRIDEMPEDRQARLQRALGDGYRVNFLIGSGGFAEVWSAEDLKLRREIAVKVLTPDLSGSSDFVDRFKREAQASARLRHPNILPIFAVGDAEGLVFFTMPRVHGDSLRMVLQTEGRLGVPEALRIACDAASALQEAHEADLVHRDVKPENIMLDGPHRRVLLMDFGIAKSVSADWGNTQTGIVIGTPRYMSPEQAAGEKAIDSRSDLYSLGLVLFEMLTGVLPFQGETLPELLAARLLQAPPQLRSFNPSLPEELEAVVARALERNPADRWQSVDEFRVALDAVPTSGLQPHRAETLSPWATRARRRIGTAALGVALVLATGASAWLILGRRSSPDKDHRAVVAVLPLRVLGTADESYFADGLADEIAQRLALTAGLAVVSRASAKAAYLRDSTQTIGEIARLLRADYVLTGSVRRDLLTSDAGQVLVAVQLVRAGDDITIWTQSYERDLSAVFHVQRDIATQVVRHLGIVTAASEGEGPGRGTASLQAHDSYLRGLEYAPRYDSESLNKALGFFEQALVLDPNYALAYAAASIVHGTIHTFLLDDSPLHVQRQEEYALRALELEPQLPEAHQAMAYYHYYGQGNLDSAEREFQAARDLQPSNAQALAGLAYVARRRGRFQNALALLDVALQLDQFSEEFLIEGATTRAYLGDYAGATQLLSRQIDQTPARPDAYGDLAEAWLLWKADYREAQHALRAGQDRAAGRYADRWALTYLFAGDLQAALDSARAARAILDPVDYHLLMGDLLRLIRGSSAKSHYDSARIECLTLLRESPGEADYLAALGKAFAGLGDVGQGARLAQAAIDSVPLSKDAFWGPLYVERLAEVQLLGGAAEAAAGTVRALLTRPSHRSEVWFLHDPRWAAVARFLEHRSDANAP